MVIHRPHILLTSLAAAAVLTAGALVGAPLAAGAPPKPATQPTAGGSTSAGLGRHDRDLLAKAVRERKPTVSLILLTDRRGTGSVLASVRRLGGRPVKQLDRVGYLNVRVPTAAVSKVAALAGVRAVDLDETIPLPDPRPGGSARARTPLVAVAPPDATTPDSNPYLPTNEIGAVDFTAANSAWDGRGVTIGILDSGVTPDHPALATTTTGEPKLVDWFNATDPVGDQDPNWLPMPVTVTGPSFTFGGRDWTAPAGTFRINQISESSYLGTELLGDLDRDRVTGATWGVLYEPETHDIRVDVDQDLDFTDEQVLRPYVEARQFGYLGTDNPQTEVAERVPFTVEYREDVGGVAGNDYVGIGIIGSLHGTHVAGIAAANGLFGGSMNGVAPGAKLVSARACIGDGCSLAALTNGLVELVANRGVDVVNISLGVLQAVNDGSSGLAELYNRLVHDYGVQLVLSGGNNGPGLNSVSDPGVAADVLAVGASISKATWLANYGAEVAADQQLFNFSSRGPREDGGLKPNVAAPGSAISTTPLWQPGAAVLETGYTLPAGYATLNGTSMAAPQTAGAVALLLSAARANALSVTPQQIRTAVMSAATLLPGAPVVGQGAGLVSVPGAWGVLSQLPGTQTYTVVAPVCTALSDLLPAPDSGTGLFNDCSRGQGGQVPLVPHSYDVTVTRTSGPSETQRHTLTWRGNDGTFSAPAFVDLPLGTPVTIPVTATSKWNDHSALLLIDAAETAGVDAFVAATVVAAGSIEAPRAERVKVGSVGRSRTQNIAVSVEPGTPALTVALSGVTDGSQVRFIAYHPYGLPLESTAPTSCYTNINDPQLCNATLRVYANPTPGVWEFEVEAARTTPLLDNPYTLTVRSQKVAFDPPTLTAAVPDQTPTPLSWSIVNQAAATTVRVLGDSLVSVQRVHPTIAQDEQQQHPIEVTTGSTEVAASIGNADPGANLNLSLYNCTTGTCVLAGKSANPGSVESVRVTNPTPGAWMVTVEGFAVPGGATGFDYSDSFRSRSLGGVVTDATPIALAAGASATISVTVTTSGPAAAGRQLEGTVVLAGPGSARLGQGTIVVQPPAG
ncbi:MAG TPA: S8 family serine peptidase [Dermatophilaceae bacterium]|nr:S8 family serine peptidase [Dermatophilaceae bacterium]